MRRVLLLIFIFFSTDVYAAPSIEFIAESHDFGEVEQGVGLEHVFEFKNSGADELIIEKLVAS